MRYKIVYNVALGVSLLFAVGCQGRVAGGAGSPESVGETMLTLEASVLRGEGTRALLEGQTDAGPHADTGEGKVASMQLWLEYMNDELLHCNTPTKESSGHYIGLFRIEGIRTAQTRGYAVMLNGDKVNGPNNLVGLPVHLYPEFRVMIDQMDHLIDPSGFTMTGKVGERALIKPNIQEPKQPDDNYLPREGAIDVERVVSKAQLYQGAGFAVQNVPGTLTNYHWSTAGGGKSVYLFRNQAGDRQMTDAKGLYEGLTTSSVLYNGKAGAYDLMKMSDYAVKEQGKLKVSDETGLGTIDRALAGAANFDWKPLGSVASGRQSTKEGIYLLEHALKETVGKTKPYRQDEVTYADIAYAKVYTSLSDPTSANGLDNESNLYLDPKNALGFAPKSLIAESQEKALKYFDITTICNADFEGTCPADLSEAIVFFCAGPESLERLSIGIGDVPGDGIGEEYAQTNTDRWYWIDLDAYVSKDSYWYTHYYQVYKDAGRIKKGPSVNFYDMYPQESLKGNKIPDGLEPLVPQVEHEFFLMHDAPGDFYLGVHDGKLYDTLLAALAAGNRAAKKYARGRMVYLTPLNAQGEPGKIYNCDTRRNNIYDLEIQGIDGLGYNYDPVDPEDPYIPYPGDNPLEPDPKAPPINKLTFSIKVKATILKWNYIRHSYDLKGPNQ